MLSEIAFFYLENDECNQAERIFRNLTYIQPFRGAMGLGAVYRREGRYEEAVTEFDEAIKINRKALDAWNSKGNALTNQGKYDEAIMAYDEPSGLIPNMSQPGTTKALLSPIKASTTRLSWLMNGHQSRPKLAYAWNSKGIALTNLDRYDEAIMAYDEAIRLDPNNADAWNSKGNALTNQGKYDEAITAYDEASCSSQDAWTWSNKGIALYSQGKYDELSWLMMRPSGLIPTFLQPGIAKALLSILSRNMRWPFKLMMRPSGLIPIMPMPGIAKAMPSILSRNMRWPFSL